MERLSNTRLSFTIRPSRGRRITAITLASQARDVGSTPIARSIEFKSGAKAPDLLLLEQVADIALSQAEIVAISSRSLKLV